MRRAFGTAAAMDLRTDGIRVAPPVRNTAEIASGVRPAIPSTASMRERMRCKLSATARLSSALVNVQAIAAGLPVETELRAAFVRQRDLRLLDSGQQFVALALF